MKQADWESLQKKVGKLQHLHPIPRIDEDPKREARKLYDETNGRYVKNLTEEGAAMHVARQTILFGIQGNPRAHALTHIDFENPRLQVAMKKAAEAARYKIAPDDPEEEEF